MKLTSPNDNLCYRYPVSIKGVVFHQGRVVILKNERDEYELPGGKLELDETPVQCVAREIQEELNVEVVVEGIVDSWLYHINNETHVVIITYFCRVAEETPNIIKSSEHKEVKFATIEELEVINIPEGYKSSIIECAKLI